MGACLKIATWAWLLLGSLSPAQAQVKTVEWIATPFTENGQPVSMEVVVFKPAGPGPFPAMLFLHGSTGTGADSRLFKDTQVMDSITRQFTAKGWLVAFPQRRGRGQSGGLYDEGFELDRSRYSCTTALSLAGLNRAVEDTRVATDWLVARSDVDPKRLLVGGQSRGGILALAFTGQHPKTFKGAINFVGGWMSDKCVNAGAINTSTFEAAAKADIPTLWLYGRDDPFYSLDHSKSNFDAFTAKGGQGSFHAFDAPRASNGHRIAREESIWRDVVSTFVNRAVP